MSIVEKTDRTKERYEHRCPGRQARCQAGTKGHGCGFLTGALKLANAEPGTSVWFALRTDSVTFWIVDAFPSDVERQAHLTGPIAAALMENAEALLAVVPEIMPAEVLAEKVTG